MNTHPTPNEGKAAEHPPLPDSALAHSQESDTVPKVVRKSKTRKAKPKPPLLFIDSNILLDFYRARNDAGITLLSKIDEIHDRVITTCQVEMEFKKNRQSVISESFSLLKPPESNLTPPAFLIEAAAVKFIKTQIQDVQRRIDVLKKRILSTLENPKTHDKIYQTTHRLFHNSSKLNLGYGTPEYKKIWRKAFRRFLEGKPPRKRNDTSMGDAINWEWIINCIKMTNRDVIIVSRDADYGLILKDKGYANNWLTEEVKFRVNIRRKLILVDRLSSALKLLDVKVTDEEITSELSIIKAKVKIHERDLEKLVGDKIGELTSEEYISSLIAETNATGWGCDEYDLDNIECGDGIYTANVTFSFSGEQDEEKPWNGDTIIGSCIVEIDSYKNVQFGEIDAYIDKYDNDDEPNFVDDDWQPPDEDEDEPPCEDDDLDSFDEDVDEPPCEDDDLESLNDDEDFPPR